MNSSRRFIVAGNWKMNKGPMAASEFFTQLGELLPADRGASKEVVLFCPSISWEATRNGSEKVGAVWGLQNAYPVDSGAFTGEVSMAMVEEIGATEVLIGHSERRQLFGETDEAVAEKVEAAQNKGLRPMICVGETLEQRESGETEKVIREQLKLALKRIEISKPFVIAYEPVWAIGTGKVATPEQADEAHSFLRAELSQLFGVELSKNTSILYGGSVKPGNAKELGLKENIDGFLIGGASLKPEDFSSIFKAC